MTDVQVERSVSHTVPRASAPFAVSPQAALETIEELVADTSLRRPSLPPDLVERPRLIKLLEQGKARSVTLVSAPAGYGKTTLANHWVRTRGIQSGWISLSDEANGLAPFFAHLVAALCRVFPSGLERSRRLTRRSGQLRLAAVSNALINDIEELHDDFVLVLDNIEVLRDRSALDLLSALLRRPPRAMHTILVGRRDPFLPIASLRGAQQVTEIRSKDLRFSADETLALLRNGSHPEARPETARAWTEATEGWITGIRLALSEGMERPGVSRAVHTLTRHVRDYLKYELLDRQPERLRGFLTRVSILDRLCAPLCDLLASMDTGGEEVDRDARDALGWMREQGLFLISLDREDRWFRLHRLVRKFLCAELERATDTNERRELHAQVSRWFADNGLTGEAVMHAVAAGDLRRAEALLEGDIEALLDGDSWDLLGEILGHFPPQTLDDRPDLLLARAWTALHDRRYWEAEATTDRAESLLRTVPPRTASWQASMSKVQTLRSSICYQRGDLEGAAMQARKALESLPTDRYFHRGAALANLIGAHWASGDRPKADALAESALADITQRTAGSRGRILALMCSLLWIDGDVAGLAATAGRCEEHARKWGLPQSRTLARLYRGLATYQRNDLAAAEKDLLTAGSCPEHLSPQEALELSHTQALIYRGQGLHDEAREVAGSSEKHALCTQTDGAPAWASEAIRADLALKQGDPQAALELADRWERHAAAEILAPFHPLLISAKALLFRDSAQATSRLERIVQRLGDSAGPMSSLRVRIEVQCLEALFLKQSGADAAALERIGEALALAQPGRFLRVFVDFGPPMASYLKTLTRKGPQPEFVREILIAYYEDRLASGGWDLNLSAQVSMTRVPAAALTRKEVEVLELLDRGLLYREIAERQFVSVETVKTHLKHVYRKLDVGNRRAAVTRARSMGLLGRV